MPSRNHRRLKLRDAAEDIGWRAREAALSLEEGVIWRGTDAVRGIAGRVPESRLGQATVRMRSVVERKLAWPLADALRDRGELARTAIATAAVVAALAAGAGGAMLASRGESGAAPGLAAASPVAPGEAVAGATLDGVDPTFVAAQGSGAALPSPQPAPKRGPERTAWDFAQAFVLYEVGRAPDVAPEFERLATPALASSLAKSPPRLPSNVKVPQARVLNVVIGEPEEKALDASVSLVRLEAVSELRLTLRDSMRGWRVSEVRG